MMQMIRGKSVTTVGQTGNFSQDLEPIASGSFPTLGSYLLLNEGSLARSRVSKIARQGFAGSGGPGGAR